jgi:hypothetical protein
MLVRPTIIPRTPIVETNTSSDEMTKASSSRQRRTLRVLMRALPKKVKTERKHTPPRDAAADQSRGDAQAKLKGAAPALAAGSGFPEPRFGNENRTPARRGDQ